MDIEPTTAEKIAILKAIPDTQPRITTPAPGQFNPNLFSPATVTAINAANAKNRFLPATEPDTMDDTVGGHVKRAADHLAKCDADMCASAPESGDDHLILAHEAIKRAIERRDTGRHSALHSRVRFVG